jgi:hypothetical protein
MRARPCFDGGRTDHRGSPRGSPCTTVSSDADECATAVLSTAVYSGAMLSTVLYARFKANQSLI